MVQSGQNRQPKFVSALVQSITGVYRDDQLKDDFLKSWRRRFGGTLLLLMYMLVFYIVVMCLTAYQIQTRVHATNELGIRQSIWSIARTADDVLVREKRIESLSLALNSRRLDLAKAEENITLAAHAHLGVKAKLIAELANLDVSVVMPADSSTDELIEAASGQTSKEIVQLKERIIEIKVENEKALDLAQLVQSKIESLNAEIVRLSEDREIFERQFKDYTRTADLMDELRFFHRAEERSEDGVLQGGLNYLFGSKQHGEKGRSSYLFVTLPSEVLIMLIVIAMGTMGSMISITQVFFAGEDRPTTFYLFRPLLGAVVAIGVYVIIKAGVIVASNAPVQVDGTAKLNAFFVSFVSLVAGLMSESAIETIKRAGTSFLRGDVVTEKSRYASGVVAAMKTAKQTASELYPFFNVSNNVVDKWLAETEAVPGEAQRVIAAWLHQPIRDLFSDIPPNNLPEER